MSRLQALLWLRHRLWWNELRSRTKVVDTVVAVILTLIGVVLSLGLAATLGFVLHIGLRGGETDGQRVALIIVFWMLAFLAVVLPVLFSLSQNGLPLKHLLFYPFSLGGLYRLSLVGSFASGTHLFWYPILVTVTIVGVVVNALPAVAWSAVAAMFTVCLVVWCYAILLLVQRLLRRRNVRELVALIGVVVVVAASTVPMLIESSGVDPDFYATPVPKLVVTVASVLPPSIAVEGVMASIAGRSSQVVVSFGWLLLWTVIGGSIGYRLLGGLLLGGDDAPRRETVSTAGASRWSGFFSIDGFSLVPSACRGIAARDLLYLLRSTNGKFNIVIMPIFVIIMGLIAARKLAGPVLGIDPSSVVFLGTMVYASTFSNNFLFNSYGWEGAGIRSYFMTPVTARQVVFGKNLGLWLYNLILAVECVVCYVAIVGLPHPSVAISGCLAFVAALVASTTAGNFVSPAMPVARDIAKTSNAPSQTGILVSFAILLANLVLIGGLVLIAVLVGSRWLQPFLLLILVGSQIVVYRSLLTPAARLLLKRKEYLVEAVQVAV